MEIGPSALERFRDIVSAVAKVSEEPIAVTRPNSSASKPGRRIMRTPANPPTIALMRRGPIFSPCTIMARIVAKMGAVKKRIVVVASGMVAMV